jgi:hypothetical protein
MPTLQEIANEIANDPKSYGYAPFAAVNNDGAIAALLNGPSNTTPTPSVWFSNVSAKALFACIVWSEVAAFTAPKWEAINTLFTVAAATGGVDATNPLVRSFFVGAFSGATDTIANMTAISKVASPTRAEELWGAGTSISATDVARALGRL